jgi:hypothetical protein
MTLRWFVRCTMALLIASLMTGCALFKGGAAKPLLRLTPASLGRELTAVQRMEVQAAGQSRSLDVALEVDASAVRMAVMQFGQTVARLDWDGQTLTQSLAPGWPSVVSAERVLSDLQLVWPCPPVGAWSKLLKDAPFTGRTIPWWKCAWLAPATSN